MNNRIANSDTSRINVMGKIRIGIKTKNKNGVEYPKAVDYFVATGNFTKEFTDHYGENPKKILIMFSNENALKQSFVLQDKELYGESDGLTVRYKDNESKIWREITFKEHEKAAEFMYEYEQKLGKKGVVWRKKLVMQFVLPELMNIFGFWSFETKGEKSMIDSITNSFDGACQLYGTISLVPFWLSVSFVESKSFGENRKFPVVSLIPAVNPIIYNQIMLNSPNPIKELIQGQSNMTTKQLPQKTLKELIPNTDEFNKVWNRIHNPEEGKSPVTIDQVKAHYSVSKETELLLLTENLPNL